MSNVIESQKNLEYHVQQIPHTIRAQGDVTFAKRHAPGRRITPTYNLSSISSLLEKLHSGCPLLHSYNLPKNPR